MSTLGITTIGGSTTNVSNGFPIWYKVVAGATFTATKVHLYCKGTTLTTTATCGIYADNAGVPGAKIQDSSETTGIVSGTPAWYDFTLDSPVSIVSGTTYWLCFANGTNDITVYYDTVSSNTSVFKSNTYVAGTLAANGSGTGSWFTNHQLSIYADDAGSPATALTLTGPTSGTVSVASTNFTVTPDGVVGSDTVTPHSTGSGTFSPTSLTFTASSVPQTFTYTPSSTAGSPHAISITDSAGLTISGSPINYAVNPAPITYGVTSTAILFSPHNTYSNGSGAYQSNFILPSSTYALWNQPGSYLRCTLNAGASAYIKVNVDPSILNGITAGNTPVLCCRINGTLVSTQIVYSASPSQVTVASGISAGTYDIEVYFKAVDLTGSTSQGTRYNAPPTSGFAGVKITGIDVDAGSTLSAPTIRSQTAVIFGDSSLEGAQNVSSSLTVSGQDAGRSWGYLIGQILGWEVGMVGNSGQGYGINGYGNVPPLYNATLASAAWPNFFSGASRLALVPDNTLSFHGINDGTVNASVLQLWMEQVRAQWTTTRLFIGVPWNGISRASIATGFGNYVASHPTDTKVYLIDPNDPRIPSSGGSGATDFGTTANHQNTYGHERSAAAYAGAIRAAIGTVTSSGPVPMIGSPLIRSLQ